MWSEGFNRPPTGSLAQMELVDSMIIPKFI